MKLNKYKIQETFCYSFITLWVIGIVLIMATSCSVSKTTAWDNAPVKKYNVENGLYTK